MGLISGMAWVGLSLVLQVDAEAPDPVDPGIPPSGRVVAVEGEVLRFMVGVEKSTNVKQGDPVYSGDRLDAGPIGRLRLILTDDAIIVLSPRSSLELSAVDLDETRGTRATVLNLVDGAMRAIFPEDDTGKRRFEIRTPASRIQMKAGHLIVQASKEQSETRALVIEGKATVTSADPMTGGLTILTTMETTEHREGQPPALGHVPADEDIAAFRELTEVRFNTDVISQNDPAALAGPLATGTALARQALMDELTSPTRAMPETPEAKLDPTKGTIEIQWGGN